MAIRMAARHCSGTIGSETIGSGIIAHFGRIKMIRFGIGIWPNCIRT